MEYSAYLVVPLTPDTLLRPDDLLTPEGLVVPIHVPGDALVEITGGAAEEGVDSIVGDLRKDLEHPGPTGPSCSDSW